MSYQHRSSPLHSARAAAGCAYCTALACAALMLSAPLVLGALTLATLLAGVLAGVWRQLRRALLLALPLAVAIVVINALISRGGLTVIARLGDLPLLGRTDITLEASAYGAILGVRAVDLILCAALYTAAVDPDEVLRMFRRISFRSALTATLATRMVPILVRDSRRMADAQRCRPGRPPSRAQLMRTATSSVLDRALDVAAALEVRGFAGARRPPTIKTPYSRHDIAFGCSALATLGIAIAAKAAALAPFQAYPSLRAPATATTAVTAVALLAAALLPFGNRRGLR